MTRQNENVPQSNTDKATPKPWYQNGLCVWAKTDDSLVARIAGPRDDDPESSANAALIVTAVNEHEALKAVSKAHETLILAMNEVDRKWLPSTPTSAKWIRKVLAESEQTIATLAAIRGAK